MHEEYTLLTPENVALRYDVAGLGSRLGAATIDYLVLVALSVVLTIGGAFVVGLVDAAFPQAAGASGTENQPLAGVVGFGFLGLTILISFLVWWGYFVVCEVIWNGQSVGKRLLRLRVVRAGGQPVGIVASLVRNLLRAVDLFLLVGVLVMLIDRSRRRLGDFAAGTLVIREPRAAATGDLLAAYGTVELPSVDAARVAALPNAGRLTTEHYAILRDFFARRPRLDRDAAQSLAKRLARELGEMLAAPPDEIADPTTFLATAVRAYETRHRYDQASR